MFQRNLLGKLSWNQPLCSLYQSFFSETGLEKFPRNRVFFPWICPWKSREIWLFFCDLPEALHKISLAWLRYVFTLFKFICSYITKPTTSKDANFASNELRNFPTKFSVKFTALVQSSWFDWQLRNEIAKLVVNFGNSEQTSEHVRQKLIICETLCNTEWYYIVTNFQWILLMWLTIFMH